MTVQEEMAASRSRAALLANFAVTICDEDAADMLTALCEVAAEVIKLSNNPPAARKHFVDYLDKFLTQPNRYIGPVTN